MKHELVPAQGNTERGPSLSEHSHLYDEDLGDDTYIIHCGNGGNGGPSLSEHLVIFMDLGDDTSSMVVLPPWMNKW